MRIEFNRKKKLKSNENVKKNDFKNHLKNRNQKNRG